MAEPSSPDALSGSSLARGWWRPLGPLALALETALVLRVLAADAVEWYVRRGGAARLDVFPDTQIYWELARAIRAGGPYEYVEWGDIPHFSIRTPGYPLWLAACQSAFGERTLPVRLAQAVLGVVCVYLVYELARRLVPVADTGLTGGVAGRWVGRVPLVAAAIAAINPNYLLMSALVLSEAVFEPLMLASLLGLAVLWPGRAGEGERAGGWGRRDLLVALGTGVANGAAVLVRPSWALFIPLMLMAWMGAGWRAGRARAAVGGAMICVLGVVIVMGPWWARNARVYGRFVPTALWMGASLYDGISPMADGSSDMIPFLRDPAIWPLDEQDQDAELTRRAVDFARENPGRVLHLALVKLGRYWSPWPQAEGFRSLALAVASAAVELPILFLIVAGLWHRRRDARAWVILAGPLLYFCALHTVFASSMRYRIPGEIPALGLAALGWSRLSSTVARRRGP